MNKDEESISGWVMGRQLYLKDAVGYAVDTVLIIGEL